MEQDFGIQVPDAKWLNKGGFDIPVISKEAILQLAREVDKAEIVVIFISRTNLHTFELIDVTFPPEIATS